MKIMVNLISLLNIYNIYNKIFPKYYQKFDYYFLIKKLYFNEFEYFKLSIYKNHDSINTHIHQPATPIIFDFDNRQNRKVQHIERLQKTYQIKFRQNLKSNRTQKLKTLQISLKKPAKWPELTLSRRLVPFRAR